MSFAKNYRESGRHSVPNFQPARTSFSVGGDDDEGERTIAICHGSVVWNADRLQPPLFSLLRKAQDIPSKIAIGHGSVLEVQGHAERPDSS